MRIHLSALAVVLAVCLGCQSPFPGAPADLCNTPGRKAYAQQIVARGGLLLTEGKQWDNSVEGDTKEKMGSPFSNVVLPQDKFNARDVAEAQLIFPEAQVSTPFTLEDFHADRAEQSDDDN
jgi:hypothetical protein